MLGRTKPATASPSNNSLTDPDFGKVNIRRTSQSRYIRLRLSPDGHLRATMPKRAPLRLLIKLINDSRSGLKSQLSQLQTQQITYADGQSIGHSHKLVITTDTKASGRIASQVIYVALAASCPPNSSEAQAFIRRYVKKALEKEARSYLPRRVKYLAGELGYSYTKIRFGNPKGRWGSYSSSGTISLNVALMSLPLELIDYVLIHELCHSRHAHHQTEFWQEVAMHQPNYRQLKADLKHFSPYL